MYRKTRGGGTRASATRATADKDNWADRPTNGQIQVTPPAAVINVCAATRGMAVVASNRGEARGRAGSVKQVEQKLLSLPAVDDDIVGAGGSDQNQTPRRTRFGPTHKISPPKSPGKSFLKSARANKSGAGRTSSYNGEGGENLKSMQKSPRSARGAGVKSSKRKSGSGSKSPRSTSKNKTRKSTALNFDGTEEELK